MPTALSTVVHHCPPASPSPRATFLRGALPASLHVCIASRSLLFLTPAAHQTQHLHPPRPTLPPHNPGHSQPSSYTLHGPSCFSPTQLGPTSSPFPTKPRNAPPAHREAPHLLYAPNAANRPPKPSYSFNVHRRHSPSPSLTPSRDEGAAPPLFPPPSLTFAAPPPSAPPSSSSHPPPPPPHSKKPPLPCPRGRPPR